MHTSLPIIVPLAIAQVHVNSSAHTILCGFESGRLTPCFDKATASAENPANCHGTSARQPLEFPRHIRRYVRRNIRPIAGEKSRHCPDKHLANYRQRPSHVRAESGNRRKAIQQCPRSSRENAKVCPRNRRAMSRR
jgi:hypothetical protein